MPRKTSLTNSLQSLYNLLTLTLDPPQRIPILPGLEFLTSAQNELSQLFDALAELNKNNLGKERVERVPVLQEEMIKNLKLARAKKQKALSAAELATEQARNEFQQEVSMQTKYIKAIREISTKYKLASKWHPVSSSTSLKSEEKLAVDLEFGSEHDDKRWLLINRSSQEGDDGVSFSLATPGVFAPRAIIAKYVDSTGAVLGQASTSFHRTNVTSSLNSRLLSRIDEHFRDAQCAWLLGKIKSEAWAGSVNRAELEVYNQDHSVIFELQQETLVPLSFLACAQSTLCSTALSLLERGKSRAVISTICRQQSAFYAFQPLLNFIPGARTTVWVHEDESDNLENSTSRCTLSLGESCRYAVEFSLRSGVMLLNWCNVPDFVTPVIGPLDLVDSYKVAVCASKAATTAELAKMSKLSAVKGNEFLVSVRNETLDSFEADVDNKGSLTVMISVANDAGNPDLSVVVMSTAASSPGVQIVQDISGNPVYLLKKIINHMVQA